MYYISIPDRISIALLDVPLTIKHYILYTDKRGLIAHMALAVIQCDCVGSILNTHI